MCASYRDPVEADGLARQLLRKVAYSDDGWRLGPVVAVYVDVDSDQAEWVGVQLDPASERCVPLVRTRSDKGSRLVFALSRRAVAESPAVPGRDLSRDDQDEMFRYYGQVISGSNWYDPANARSLTDDGPIQLRRLTRQDLMARRHLWAVSRA